MYKKIYNARAQQLICSLNLLFGDVLVAVAIIMFAKTPYQGFKQRDDDDDDAQ